MIPIITQPHRSLHRKKFDGLKKVTNIEDQHTYTGMLLHKQEAELEQNILRRSRKCNIFTRYKFYASVR